MAESGSGQEKTEEPSARKLQKARDEGQVPRSRELNTLLMLIVSGAVFLFVGKTLVSGLLGILETGFVMERQRIFEASFTVKMLWQSFEASFWLLLPILGVLFLAALISPLIVSGWTFSGKALVPKLERMDPVKGLGRVLGWKGLVELAKALAKFLIVSLVGYSLLIAKLPEFLSLGNLPLHQGLATVGWEMLWVFIILSCTLILVAAVDVPFQLWDFRRQQKMTRQELKDEHKETEGNPELKSKVRVVQREMASRRMMEKVPDADVVITNPTHYSVALKYDVDKMRAPVVVALGADLVALQIRRVAVANDVPVMESAVLARALFFNSELNEEIPAGLYMAVAQVLAYIYQLKQSREDGTKTPHKPVDLPIPEEFRSDQGDDS